MTAHPKLPSAPRKSQNLIGGTWSDSDGGEIVRVSPAHGVPVSVVPRGTAADVDKAVAAARRRFEGGGWAELPASSRAAILRKAADLIVEQKHELALIETLESGKPLWQSVNEVTGAADLWYYASGQAQAMHGETFNNLGHDSLGLVLREPIGVVGLITPWNFPFYILAERLPFILAAGCTVVMKPSEHTSSTTLMMGRILEQAGLPEGVVNIVTGYGDPVGQAIVNHMDIDMVSFTGSTRVGRSTVIASASNIKKVSLELGGKNPVVVTADADLDKAADGIVYGVLHNAGQCCVSGSRLIVHESVEKALTGRILDLMAKVRTGDPLLPETRVGAIVNETQMQRILGLIDQGKAQGGRLMTGGGRMEPQAGYFVEPTLFTGITPDMAIAREEVFGPVLGISTFKSTADAIRMANDTEYGLAATIWSSDLRASMDLMRGIRAGRMWINTTITGGPEMPIGGYKQSGLGRETGPSGIDEYTEVKSVIVDLGARQPWVI
ncbi:aldehyde dehydrogenase family protein [Mesorhizobium sp. B2-3-4]|uniref:aldehyde dehydrogenase family protein n=1 Tax=Mesorhizobium sp. B2-3-4 TaxID=2589959 RepID=UPI00112E5D8B|nr:aldehyde dehydrogenase family protein [Mesorhizobium sp. B2-3-4]TPM28296.1 aldehyde dehydrogenase family protein [Mesorhizobium sp. B2-3-4]